MNNPLTPREREVLTLTALGHTGKMIGRVLGISHRTAEVHRLRALKKLGLSGPQFMAALWRAAGFESPAVQGLVKQLEGVKGIQGATHYPDQCSQGVVMREF